MGGGGARADGSGGVETRFTKEFILLVFGCHEGGQCGDLSPGGGGGGASLVTPVFP